MWIRTQVQRCGLSCPGSAISAGVLHSAVLQCLLSASMWQHVRTGPGGGQTAEDLGMHKVGVSGLVGALVCGDL